VIHHLLPSPEINSAALLSNRWQQTLAVATLKAVLYRKRNLIFPHPFLFLISNHQEYKVLSLHAKAFPNPQ